MIVLSALFGVGKVAASRGTSPLPRPATQNLGYPMGGRAGERAGAATGCEAGQ